MKKIQMVVAVIVAAGIAAWWLDDSGWLTGACASLLISVLMMHYAVRNVLVVSYRKRIFDLPDSRRVHKTPTPRLGGLVFAPIILCAAVLPLSAFYLFLDPASIPPLRCLILVVPMTVLWMVGTVDDLIGVAPRYKLIVQIVAGLLVIYSGFWFDDLHGFMGIHRIPAWLGMSMTVLFIVAMVNAFNLIDGIDGLASGLCMLVMAVYGLHFYRLEQYHFMFMAVSAIGVLGPFFYTNVVGLGQRRHKMFMGDTGSLTMGMIAGVMAVALIGGWEGDEVTTRQNFVGAVSPLLVPMFDLLHVVFFRLRRGEPAFKPDKTHLHHRLMRKGFKAKQALALILGLAAGLLLLNSALAPRMNATWIFLIDIVMWSAFNSRLLKCKNKK